jgi:hypothetical protein
LRHLLFYGLLLSSIALPLFYLLPSAYAPGFMLTPASPAKSTSFKSPAYAPGSMLTPALPAKSTNVSIIRHF